MRTMLAYIAADGQLMIDSEWTDEADVWRIALGWPSPDEIEEAKRKGDRVVRVELPDSIIRAIHPTDGSR